MADDISQRLCNPVYNFCDDIPLIKLVASIIEKHYPDVQRVHAEVYDERGTFKLQIMVEDDDIISVYRNSLQFNYISTIWRNHRHTTEGIIPLSASLTEFLTEVGSVFKIRDIILAKDAYDHAEYGKAIV